MSFSEIFLIWSQNSAVSAVVWIVLLTLLAYFARVPMHQMINAFSEVLKSAFNQASEALKHAEKNMSDRNTQVLIAAGREAAEHLIEREFSRITTIVEDDLSKYPSLHRRMDDVVTRLDEDYKKSAEVPPEAPGWANAVEAVANIKTTKDDPMVGQILTSIHGTLDKNHEKTLESYRKATRERHSLLKRMRPAWRSLNGDLKQVDQHVTSLIERSHIVDRQMDEYEKIVTETDSAKKTLSSSSLTQFFIAGFVLLIAIGGAAINFNLIARPMQEMVGGSGLLMGFKTANIAALVIILVEVAMGLFLMESLRITRLFPVIGSMNDTMRVRMIYITFSILFILASVEAGLAYMREILAQEDAALRASLISATVEASGSSEAWITTAAQMGMGFILPFALTFVAIPLESFIHAARTVLGIMTCGFLHFLSVTFSMFANSAHHLGQMFISIYDLFIFIPIWIETQIKSSKKSERKPMKEAVS